MLQTSSTIQYLAEHGYGWNSCLAASLSLMRQLRRLHDQNAGTRTCARLGAGSSRLAPGPRAPVRAGEAAVRDADHLRRTRMHKHARTQVQTQVHTHAFAPLHVAL